MWFLIHCLLIHVRSTVYESLYCCTAAVSIMKTTIATTLSAFSSNTTIIQQMAKPSLSLIVNSSLLGMVRKMDNSPSHERCSFCDNGFAYETKTIFECMAKNLLDKFCWDKSIQANPTAIRNTWLVFSYQHCILNYIGMTVF